MVRWAAIGTRWLLSPGAARFRAALVNPAEAQARVRARLLAGARATTYGRGFRRWADVPVVGWEEMAPWVERQRQEGGRVLVPDPVRFYESTSGSTGRVKAIPYTTPLLRSFSRMFGLWAHDLLAGGPPFRTGRLYFSVSPRFGPTRAPGEGTTDDRDYLTGWIGRWMRRWWVSPPGAAQAPDAETYWRRVAGFLAGEPRLEVISVWSPSFLQVLLTWMEAHRAELPRADLIGDWTRLWPELKLVSCWAAGTSARGAADLTRRFPGVLVQGKGLLATEAPVTVPLLGVGPVPLVDTIGIELERDGVCLPVEEAEPDGVYAVVVSQPAGLLRYRLGDQVRVAGRVGRTPVLELLGRPALVDLVGEKLGEAAVSAVFDRVGLGGEGYAALVPSTDHYVLVLDRPAAPALAGAVDAALAEGFHYGRARALGQLGPVRLLVVPDAAARALAAGAVWGGTKPRLLRPDARGFEPWIP